MSEYRLLPASRIILIESLPWEKRMRAETRCVFDVLPEIDDQKFHNMITNLSLSFKKLSITLNRYQERYKNLLEDGSAELSRHLLDIHTQDCQNGQYLIELYDPFLLADLEIFFVCAKTTIDILVQFFDYKYKTNLWKFSKKGKSLLKEISRNKKIKNKSKFKNFISQNQRFINEVIALRDKTAHYSSLMPSKTLSFHYVLDDASKTKLTHVNSMLEPLIEIRKGEFAPTKKYLDEVYSKTINFCSDFVGFCYQSPQSG